jgi:hypothetical protein
LEHVVREHLETFLAEARWRGGGEGLPRFVERELREFLGCGVLARGFARFRCKDCQREILVAFSCDRRFVRAVYTVCLRFPGGRRGFWERLILGHYDK